MPEFDTDEELDVLTERLAEFLKPKIKRLLQRAQKDALQSNGISTRVSKEVETDTVRKPGRPRKDTTKAPPAGPKNPVGRPRVVRRSEREAEGL